MRVNCLDCFYCNASRERIQQSYITVLLDDSNAINKPQLLGFYCSTSTLGTASTKKMPYPSKMDNLGLYVDLKNEGRGGIYGHKVDLNDTKMKDRLYMSKNYRLQDYLRSY